MPTWRHASSAGGRWCRCGSRLVQLLWLDAGQRPTCVQIVAVYLVQHAMLVGLTLPFFAIASAALPWRITDSLACATCASSLLIAGTADSQLHRHCSARTAQGATVLQTGLWGWCRHPNHLGEMLWWWGVWLFSLPSGHSWTVIGTAFNSACMLEVRGDLTIVRSMHCLTRCECRSCAWSRRACFRRRSALQCIASTSVKCHSAFPGGCSAANNVYCKRRLAAR